MKSLKLFDEKNKLHSDVIGLFLDKSIISRHKSITAYCKENKLKLDENNLKKLTKIIEKTIYNQVYYYAHLMYHYMQKSGDWGNPGEQQVKITFCRNLLKIVPKQPIEPTHVTKFESLTKKNIETLNIHSLSASSAEIALKNFKFKLFGKQFELFKSALVNSFLQFCESKLFLHCGQYGKQMEFIMGTGKKTKKQGYNITFVNQELIRTPNNVISMAAIIGHQNIYIRLESLKIIFVQKWLQIFDYTEMDLLTIHADPYWNISEGIKLKVLEKHKIETKEDLIDNEQTFIKDMSETILYHELGHGIIQHDILPFELGAIGEGTKIYGENIYTAILEFLADFSPKKDSIKGPIQNMIDISKKDYNRAVRMYLMYMSDTWFYNTEDTYMYTYSDLMILILIRYLKENDTIDFEQMEKELLYHKSKPISHFDKILSIYNTDILELKSMIENASFNASGQTLNYQKIREFLIEEFRKNDGFVHTDTYEFLVPFWTNIIGYVQKLSNENNAISTFLSDRQTKAIKKIMILSCGKEIATSYNYDHRKYIIDRMHSLNILAINPETNHN